MKIAFFGTPDFAANLLAEILEYEDIDCQLVVSQPDKATGRKKELMPTPVKRVALERGIEVLQPDKIKPSLQTSPEALTPTLGLPQRMRGYSQREREQTANSFIEVLKNLDLDFIVVVAYGKIIPQAILDIPKYGCINIHGSILPKYRGASPVQAALKAGESETGLTTMYMSAGMDEGDILKIGKVIVDKVDTSEDIFKKFVDIGPELLVTTLREILSGKLAGTPQNDLEATYCGKISREDGEVFFAQQNAEDIYNTFRAYTPWPGIYSFYKGKRLVFEALTPTLGLPQRMRGCSQGEREQDYTITQGNIFIEAEKHCSFSLLGGERIQEGGFVGESENLKPGTCLKLSKNRYGIVCADKKILEICRVKLEGKKSMDAVSFVNGNREVVGYVFE